MAFVHRRPATHLYFRMLASIGNKLSKQTMDLLKIMSVFPSGSTRNNAFTGNCLLHWPTASQHSPCGVVSKLSTVEWFKSFPKNDYEIWCEHDFQTTQLARISTKHVCDCVCVFCRELVSVVIVMFQFPGQASFELIFFTPDRP